MSNNRALELREISQSSGLLTSDSIRGADVSYYNIDAQYPVVAYRLDDRGEHPHPIFENMAFGLLREYSQWLVKDPRIELGYHARSAIMVAMAANPDVNIADLHITSVDQIISLVETGVLQAAGTLAVAFPNGFSGSDGIRFLNGGAEQILGVSSTRESAEMERLAIHRNFRDGRTWDIIRCLAEAGLYEVIRENTKRYSESQEKGHVHIVQRVFEFMHPSLGRGLRGTLLPRLEQVSGDRIINRHDDVVAETMTRYANYFFDSNEMTVAFIQSLQDPTIVEQLRQQAIANNGDESANALAVFEVLANITGDTAGSQLRRMNGDLPHAIPTGGDLLKLIRRQILAAKSGDEKAQQLVLGIVNVTKNKLLTDVKDGPGVFVMSTDTMLEDLQGYPGRKNQQV